MVVSDWGQPYSPPHRERLSVGGEDEATIYGEASQKMERDSSHSLGDVP